MIDRQHPNAQAGDASVTQALALISGKWKPLILWRLAAGAKRKGDLMRELVPVSHWTLLLQLRELERDGLVRRTAQAATSRWVEYALTTAAQGLVPVLTQLGPWLSTERQRLREAAHAAAQRNAIETDADDGDDESAEPEEERWTQR